MISLLGGFVVVVAALVATLALGLLVNWLYKIIEEQGGFPTRPSWLVAVGGVLFLLLCGGLALAVQFGSPLGISGGSASTSSELTVRVQDAETQVGVNNAQVVLEQDGVAPFITYTDSNGYALLPVNETGNAPLMGLLRIAASDYQPVTRHISTDANITIELRPE